FINKLTNNEPSAKTKNKADIYFVSISKMIEWIEYRVPLDVIANKWLWYCEGTSYDYDEECESVKKLKANTEEMEEMKKKNRRRELEFKMEGLFLNGVFTALVIVFILCILFTIIYDKYILII